MVLLDVDLIYKPGAPDINDQKTQILERLKEPMVVGQTWYLIDAKWYKSFKSFVGIENPNRCNSAINPGPIDNSLLLDVHCTKIREGLVPDLDYVVIPTSAWILLTTWYGTKESQQPIGRKIINVARPPKVDMRVEVYEIELNLYDNTDFINPVTYSFSSGDLISKIENVCRKLFNVPEEAQIQLRCFYGGPTYSQVLRSGHTVNDESLSNNLKIVMDVLPEKVAPGQSKIISRPSVSRSREVSRIPRVVGPGVVTRHGTTLGAGTLGSAEGRGQPCTPGLSGLMNLGNTCFINSILQCLSNCGPITQYFQNGCHKREINTTNPLGTAGKIACSFADVISMIWSGRHAITVPHFFKLQLTDFAPQFAGFQQHDAQEVLTFLLDGLHEDLNRVKTKPYLQAEEEYSDDSELAESSWIYFKSRNDSIIIDNFHGMLKSRVVCPDCEKVSVKFDTFSTLSLPLLLKCNRTVSVRWVPYDQNKSVTDLKVIVPIKGTIHDMAVELSNATQVSQNCIVIAEINQSHFHRFFAMDDPIQSIDEQDRIFMYDLPADMVNNETCEHTVLPVVLWEVDQSSRSSHFTSCLFGTPFLLYLPRRTMDFKQLYDCICERMMRNCKAFMENNTNFGCFPMDYEESDGEANKNEINTYLFNPILVNSFDYGKMKRLQEDDPFEVPESFGRELLALQINRQLRVQEYCEPPVVQAPSSSTDTSQTNPQPSLLDCLDLFISTEKLGESNAWHCPQCNKKKRATKKLDLWKLPNILILHLKRFAFNEVQKEKLDIKVDFPLTGLKLDHIVMKKHQENLEYNLIGVCNHNGSLAGGHYTAYCKSYKDGNWYCFDDNNVTPISPNSFQTERAYMLFYQRYQPSIVDPVAKEKFEM